MAAFQLSGGWAPCHPLQHALKDRERAYRNFFAKRSAFPRFKRKGCGESLRYPDSKQFEIDQANSRIKLPKLGWVRYRNSRQIPGQARSITCRALPIGGTPASRQNAKCPSQCLRPPRPLASTWELPVLPP